MSDPTLSWLAPLTTADFVQKAVAQGIATNQSKSEQAAATVNALVNNLGGFLTTISDVPLVSTELGQVTATVDGFMAQARPVKPALDATFPDAPADVILGSVGEITLDAVPVLTAAEPSLSTIAPPVKFTAPVPVAEALPDRAYPDKPASAMPTAKPLRELTLPSAPTPITVNFDGVMPADLDAPPSGSFDFTEVEYQSILNDNLKTKLLSLVLNTAQTGLSESVRQQMWDKSRELTSATTQGLIDSISRQYARSGHVLPAGDEAERVFQAMETGAEQDVAENRNIAITEADLEQKNFQFAFTQALALESQLMVHHNEVQQRSFDAAKYVIEAAINLYNVKIAYFNAGVTLFTAQAQVYRDRIQAELSKVELYKAELEGQRLIGDLNKQDIDNYRSQIEAVVAVFGLYKDELDAVKTQIEGDRLKVALFEANIRAYAETIRAKSLEYDGYKAELSGEEIKAKTYDSLVGAFGKRIEAFSSITEAKIKKQDADIKVSYDIPLRVLEQQTSVFKTKVLAKTSEIEGVTALYKADADVYGTEVGAEGTRINAQVSVQKQEIDYLTKKADVAIEAIKANVATFMSQKELILGALKTIAQVESQLAAAFGGAVNYSASMNAGESQSFSNSNSSSYSNSISDSTTHSS